jgi:predicted MFS family arabinose efflux permease
MSEETMTAAPDVDHRGSWLAMAVIGLGQAQMTFNVSALPVSISGMVASFDVPPTTIGTAIVMYSLGVAAFIMLGAKLGQMFGSRNVFQVMSAVFAAAMVLMTLAPTAFLVLVAQGIAGLAASAIVPTLVVLIANNYKGKQQAQALGLLGGIQALAGMLAFFAAGSLGTLLSWRFAFAILIPWALAVVFLSRYLAPVAKVPGIKIDPVGVILAAAAIILISFGFNNLNRWGILSANPAAPFSIAGLSPAPVMIVLGLVLLQTFLVRCRRRAKSGRTPLLAMEVIESTGERMAVLSMMAIIVLGNCVTFLTPLYIQMVQGRSSFQTAVNLIPYQLSIFAAAVLVVRLYDTITPRQIARAAFVVVALGLIGLAMTFRNEWNNLVVILCLIVIGLGQGALVTLVFNVLVTASPKQFAGDVGALRGTTSNLAAGVGTALAGALVIGILSINVAQSLVDHPTLAPELVGQVNMDNITFVSNDRLRDVMARTSATPEQTEEAIAINEEARLRALKLSLLLLAGLAALAIIPAGGLPNYVRGELPAKV